MGAEPREQTVAVVSSLIAPFLADGRAQCETSEKADAVILRVRPTEPDACSFEAVIQPEMVTLRAPIDGATMELWQAPPERDELVTEMLAAILDGSFRIDTKRSPWTLGLTTRLIGQFGDNGQWREVGSWGAKRAQRFSPY